MSNPRSPTVAPVPAATDQGRRSLRWAWVSVALIPVAFVAAMFIGEGLLSLQGYESGSEKLPPIGAALLASLPALLVMIAPDLSAIWCGLLARRHGLRNGIFPAVIGIVAAAFAVITAILPRLLGV